MPMWIPKSAFQPCLPPKFLICYFQLSIRNHAYDHESHYYYKINIITVKLITFPLPQSLFFLNLIFLQANFPPSASQKKKDDLGFA